MSAVNIFASQDTSDGSETDRDTLGPLPAPGHVQPWSNYPTFSAPPSLGPIYNPAPPPSTYMSFAGPSVLPINQSPRFVLFTVFKTFLLRIDFCSSGSSGGGSIRHTLAASGSGSESEVGGNMSNHAANLSISNHPTNHSNLTLSNHPTNMNNFLTEPPTGPPPLPPGGSFMIPQSGM